MNVPRFILREWQLSDAASLVEHANNIHVWNNLRDAFPYPYTEEDGQQFITKAMNIPKPTTLMAIEVDGKSVGSISITLHTDIERITAELGYFIGENYWNRGIMSEAVKEMVSYAFLHFPELKKIYATPFGFNIASQRVLQKAGFECEGILKQTAIKNGKVIDEHYYSMLKSLWVSNVHHRFFRQEDYLLLESLLYEAIFQPDGAEPLPRAIIKKPEINSAIRDFGKKPDDFCLFAELNGKTVGGAWMRISDGESKSFGYIDSETPELVITVFKEYRNLGIGQGLMHHLIDSAKGYKQISLSVDKRNYAVEMYKKFGFKIERENEQDYAMVLKIKG
ncbi:MAG: GNAT family N-acetyltransferase [Bacteroidales bacterium]|jgi:RimJ/RimL family protein N-acetyltransferase|nr:GNAT family N-acetyltransferase [Bacteroidales bacterium]